MEDYKKKEKWEQRQRKYDVQDARREKRRDRKERNVIGIVGFVIAANALVISFTGWHVWIAVVAFILCLIATGRRRPPGIARTLAIIGLAVSAIAMINAVRVSNQWVVTDAPTQTSVVQMIEMES